MQRRAGAFTPRVEDGRLRLTSTDATESSTAAFAHSVIEDVDAAVYQFDFDLFLTPPEGAAPAEGITFDDSRSNAGSNDTGERIAFAWSIVSGKAVIRGPAFGPTVNIVPQASGIIVVRLLVDDGQCENPAAASVSFTALGGTPFIRGEVNADRAINIADAIATLSYLFANGKRPTCLDTADANDDGALNIADPIRLLGYLFANTGPLPPPTTECASDPIDDAIDCVSYAPCQ